MREISNDELQAVSGGLMLFTTVYESGGDNYGTTSCTPGNAGLWASTPAPNFLTQLASSASATLSDCTDGASKLAVIAAAATAAGGPELGLAITGAACIGAAAAGAYIRSNNR
jgi:bacteriocin-like protein